MTHVLAKELKESLLVAALTGCLTKHEADDTNIHDYINVVLSEKKETSKKDITTPLSNVDDELDIPDYWEYVRLNDLVAKEIRRGKSPKYDEKGYALAFAQKCNSKYTGIRLDLALHLSDASLARYSEVDNMQDNDIVINSTGGGTLGRVGLYKAAFNTTNVPVYPDSHVTVVRAKKCVNPLYLYLCIKKMSPYMETLGEGSTNQTELKPQVVKDLIIPLPPIEEQARIVARVDELMAEIDEYEKLENELVELKKNFPGDMKVAVLQAAMQGKLTEQLESDSNAFILAETIKNERKARGKNKYVTDSVNELDIPETWTTIKSGECFSLEKGEKVSGVSLPYLEAKYLRGKTSATIMSSGEFVSKGTEVILVDGENSGEIFIEPEDGIIGSTFKILFIPKSINKNYALYFLSMNRDLFRNNKKGAAIPHLSKEIFNDLTMPIPPIEEQQRIVEKLDKLLPLCDALCEESYGR